jgi:hypothetical protein
MRILNASVDEVVELLGEFANAEPKWIFGSQSYIVGQYTVNKDGDVLGLDEETFAEFIRSRGLEWELQREKQKAEDDKQAFNSAEVFIITLPYAGDQTILRRIVDCKEAIICNALAQDGIGRVPLSFTDTSVSYAWIRRSANAGVVAAWTKFFTKLTAFAAGLKNCKMKKQFSYNNAYDMRVFLYRIGMESGQYKSSRSVIMQHLTGDPNFLKPEHRETWNEHWLAGGSRRTNKSTRKRTVGKILKGG